MCSRLILSFLVTSLFWNAVVTVKVEQKDPDTSFVKFEEASNCFKDIKQTENATCEFLVKENQAASFQCFPKSKFGEPVLRIIGDFQAFTIQCKSNYPLDFVYKGIMPNEGILINWWKEVMENVYGDEIYSELDKFVINVEVLSVDGLFNWFNDSRNSYYENILDGIPYKKKHDYPRSGNFTFPPIFPEVNPFPELSFYFIIEDGSRPELFRNNETMITLKDGFLIIPCIGSHLHPDVTVSTTSSNILIEGIEHHKLYGFSIPVDQPGYIYDGIYTCDLKHNNIILDTLKLVYKHGELKYLPGFLDISTRQSIIQLDLEGENRGDYTRITPVCKEIAGADVNPQNRLTIAVPMENFGFMRMRQLFALPDHSLRSYSARNSSKYDPLIRTITIESVTKVRMLTVFCRFGESLQIRDFGASLTVGKRVPFAFGRDWARFPRYNSSVETHFIIGRSEVGENILYVNTTVGFTCKVNIPVVVVPIIWYTRRKNGDLVREFIDYKLDPDLSIFKVVLTEDMNEVICYGSYWYSQWYRSISIKLNTTQLPLKYGSLPKILDTESKIVIPTDAKTGTIQCEAKGDPFPLVMLTGKGIQGKQTINKTLLVFDAKPSYVGNYLCIAQNLYGQDTKEFTVEFQSDIDTYIAVIVAIVVFILTTAAAFVYIKYFRKEKTGLTKDEIEQFIKGLKEHEGQDISKSDYAHEFAHLVPYTGQYEIPLNKFQVDNSEVLGCGAYGMVLKGYVEKEIVAVKTTKRNADKQYLKALLSELKIIIYLGYHPNLVHIVGAYTKELSKGIVYVFIKYLENGSLEKFLRSRRNFFTEGVEYANTIANRLDPNTFDKKDLLRWCIELANGMEYLSSKKVIHGDLAARNLLLDDIRSIRITDFGLSRQLYDYSDYVKKQQEPLPWRWMALESLKFLSFSSSSDVWSFGVTVWEIFSLAEVPYPGYSWTLSFVEELENGLRMSTPKFGSPKLYQIMTECWHNVPEKRPKFSDLKSYLNTIWKTEEIDWNAKSTALNMDLSMATSSKEIPINQPKSQNVYSNTPLELIQ